MVRAKVVAALAHAEQTVRTFDGSSRELGSKATFRVPAGAVVRYETCGGGGYGDPAERDPDCVRTDVIEGKISRERAAAYGVAFRPGGLDIDAAATQRLRRRAGAA